MLNHRLETVATVCSVRDRVGGFRDPAPWPTVAAIPSSPRRSGATMPPGASPSGGHEDCRPLAGGGLAADHAGCPGHRRPSARISGLDCTDLAAGALSCCAGTPAAWVLDLGPTPAPQRHRVATQIVGYWPRWWPWRTTSRLWTAAGTR